MSDFELPWIILITHGNLGKELISSVEMIGGRMKRVKAIPLLPEVPPEELADIVKKELEGIPRNSLILTDLFGGTPSNVSAAFARQGYYVLTGVNMAILLEADMYRSTGKWEDALEYLVKIGSESIVNISKKIG